MDESATSPAPRRGLKGIPRGVWALGFVSLLMDTSSELIHSLLPVFLVSVLGASALSVGVIEGVAEATAAIVKVFSGTLSDYLGKRKPLAVAGYGLAALTKPLFPLAGSVGWVFAARFVDRIGKGIRGAPRDALIGDIAPPALRGACYGLRQSLDTVGAFAGPLLGLLFMALLADNIHAVFWIAVAPAVLAVAVLVVAVEEPPATRERAGRVHAPIRVRDVARMGTGYWLLTVVAAVLTMARFSEAFLVLRAQNLGMRLTWIPLVIVLMSIVYALSSYPAGVLSDRVDRKRVLLLGIVFLLAADFVLATARGVSFAMLGVALWGLHMGFSQGLLSTMVADAAPGALRGTAFGVYNLICGVTMLLASVLAGWLWGRFEPEATFAAGGGFAFVAALLLLALAAREAGGRRFR